MNKVTILMGCLGFAWAGQAAAQCTANTRLNSASDIEAHLQDMTVCGTGVGASAGDQWQEWHQTSSGGTLTEYAKGTGDPVDPTHDVGTWSTSGAGSNAVVTYVYDGGDSYSFNVHVDGSTTYFCNDTTEVANAFLLSGQQSCGF